MKTELFRYANEYGYFEFGDYRLRSVFSVNTKKEIFEYASNVKKVKALWNAKVQLFKTKMKNI